MWLFHLKYSFWWDCFKFIQLSDYVIGCQLVESTWSFTAITFEESVIFINRKIQPLAIITDLFARSGQYWYSRAHNIPDLNSFYLYHTTYCCSIITDVLTIVTLVGTWFNALINTVFKKSSSKWSRNKLNCKRAHRRELLRPEETQWKLDCLIYEMLCLLRRKSEAWNRGQTFSRFTSCMLITSHTSTRAVARFFVTGGGGIISLA